LPGDIYRAKTPGKERADAALRDPNHLFEPVALALAAGNF